MLLAFHGTPRANLPSILHDGLDPARRQTQMHGAGEYFGKQMITSTAAALFRTSAFTGSGKASHMLLARSFNYCRGEAEYVDGKRRTPCEEYLGR